MLKKKGKQELAKNGFDVSRQNFCKHIVYEGVLISL